MAWGVSSLMNINSARTLFLFLTSVKEKPAAPGRSHHRESVTKNRKKAKREIKCRWTRRDTILIYVTMILLFSRCYLHVPYLARNVDNKVFDFRIPSSEKLDPTEMTAPGSGVQDSPRIEICGGAPLMHRQVNAHWTAECYLRHRYICWEGMVCSALTPRRKTRMINSQPTKHHRRALTVLVSFSFPYDFGEVPVSPTITPVSKPPLMGYPCFQTGVVEWADLWSLYYSDTASNNLNWK